MSVAADGLAELGADQGQGVPPVVAFLVEGRCSEVVLRGSEDPLYPLGVAEDVLQEINLFCLIVQDGGVDFQEVFLHLLDLFVFVFNLFVFFPDHLLFCRNILP